MVTVNASRGISRVDLASVGCIAAVGSFVRGGGGVFPVFCVTGFDIRGGGRGEGWFCITVVGSLGGGGGGVSDSVVGGGILGGGGGVWKRLNARGVEVSVGEKTARLETRVDGTERGGGGGGGGVA